MSTRDNKSSDESGAVGSKRELGACAESTQFAESDNLHDLVRAIEIFNSVEKTMATRGVPTGVAGSPVKKSRVEESEFGCTFMPVADTTSDAVQAHPALKRASWAMTYVRKTGSLEKRFFFGLASVNTAEELDGYLESAKHLLGEEFLVNLVDRVATLGKDLDVSGENMVEGCGAVSAKNVSAQMLFGNKAPKVIKAVEFKKPVMHHGRLHDYEVVHTKFVCFSVVFKDNRDLSTFLFRWNQAYPNMTLETVSKMLEQVRTPYSPVKPASVEEVRLWRDRTGYMTAPVEVPPPPEDKPGEDKKVGFSVWKYLTGNSE